MSDGILQSLANRAVAVETARREAVQDMKELRAEAKSKGIDPQVFNGLVKDLMDPEKREARERLDADIAELKARLGPLGAAAASALRKAVGRMDALADKHGTVTVEGLGRKITFGTKVRRAERERIEREADEMEAAERNSAAPHEAPRHA